MGKSKKRIRNRNKKKKTMKFKKQKKLLLRGGWKKSDADFIAYEKYLNDEENKMGNVIDFLGKIEQELLVNSNTTLKTNFTSLNKVIKYIREKLVDDHESIVELLRDDYIYNMPKLSIITKGTIFYRRQKTNEFVSKNKEIWLDYTGTMSVSPFSFLKDYNEKYTKEQYDATIEYFGEYLMEFRVKNDVLILHFPSYVYSYLESWVRYMCTYIHANCCVDGYTLDFLKFNPNEVYSEFKSLDGFRELCVLNAQNMELV